MLGIHAASMGGVPALMAKVALTVCSRMYVNERASPMPRYSHMPPFRLRDDSEAPIIVRMNDANDVA